MQRAWAVLALHTLGCSIPTPALFRPSPEAAARAMVDTALPADWTSGFDNLGALSGDLHKEESLRMITAVAKFGKVSGFESAMGVFQYRAYIRPLFRAGLVQTEKLKLFNARLTNIEPETFSEWFSAIKAKCKDTPEWMAAFELMQIETFWNGDRHSAATRKRTLARLSSITGFESWTPASNCSDNLMYILQTEPLFDGDRFDAELFRQALPIAQDTHKKRSADQEAFRAAGRGQRK